MLLRFWLLATVVALLTCRTVAQDSSSDAQLPAANPSPSAQSSQNTPDANSGAYRVGGGVSPPKVIHDVDPEYSKQARNAGYQGTVVLWLIVDAEGNPKSIRVQRALGMGLDEEAIKAVKRWRFEPAKKDGQPVPVMINVEVNFRLYETLSPHPDSAGQAPRFPGVDTTKYPLVLHVDTPSFDKVGSHATATLTAMITEGGQQQALTISCVMNTRHCLALDEGNYAARWQDKHKSLQIVGLSDKGKWMQTEYTVVTQ